MPGTRHSPRGRGRLHMKRAWLVFRSAILWIVSGLHFFLVVPALILFGIFLDTRKHDWLQRGFCRRIAFLSGAQVEVRRSAGFNVNQTSFFMANRSEEHTSELQSRLHLVCRLLLEKKKQIPHQHNTTIITRPTYT